MASILSHILDFMFPAECHICGRGLARHERFACSHCLSQLPRTGYHRTPLNPMEERFAGLFKFDRATGHFFYTRDSALSQLIQDMKYRNFPSIGNMLGALSASELYSTGFFSDIDMVVPVPMHFLKQLRRGYNQSMHIARGISESTGIRVCPALKAVRSHRTQTALTHDERRQNTSGLFSITKPGIVAGKHVLLTDDVCTTGATLSAAAEAIWQGHPASLSLLTIGVTF